jgi:hypothetical protein
MRNKIDIVVILLGAAYAVRYPWPSDPLAVLDLLVLLIFAAATTISIQNLIQRRRSSHARKN